jgi:site-specific DNA-cytosine methylase
MMVIERRGLRRLSITEMLRLFGFEDSMVVNMKRNEIVDLLGNSVPVNIVEAVSERLLRIILQKENYEAIVDNTLTAKQEALFI